MIIIDLIFLLRFIGIDYPPNALQMFENAEMCRWIINQNKTTHTQNNHTKYMQIRAPETCEIDAEQI